MFWTFQNIRIGLRTNTKVAANEYEVIRINTVLCDAQRMPIRIGSQTTFATVGRGHNRGLFMIMTCLTIWSPAFEIASFANWSQRQSDIYPSMPKESEVSVIAIIIYEAMCLKLYTKSPGGGDIYIVRLMDGRCFDSSELLRTVNEMYVHQ